MRRCALFLSGARRESGNWCINHYLLLGSLAAALQIIEEESICRQMEIRAAAVDLPYTIFQRMKSEETDIEICRESSDFYNLFGRSHHPPFHRRNALIEDNGQEAQHHNGCDDHCHGKEAGTHSDEYSGRFYTPIPEIGNHRSDMKETAIPF